MRFSASVLTTAIAGITYGLLISQTQAFSINPAFIQSSYGANHVESQSSQRSRMMTVLFADVVEEVPTEVSSLDGIADTDEAHNNDRPARKELKKKRPPKGTPLSELTIGSSVKAVVKSVASYGAFCDLGAASDGLLHISRMSKDYVGNVSDILAVGQEVDVRIISVDQQKNQIALSLLTEEEETEAKASASASQNKSRDNKRERRSPAGQQSSRGANPVLASLVEKGYDSEKFVTGKVVSTVAFGAFVRVEANQFHESMEGDFEGLVHISALTAGRASSVTDFVKVDDVVNVRVRSIDDGKVSLTMVSYEDEQSQNNARAEAQIERSGASDWKESLERMKKDMPVFSNSPLIVNMRK